MRTVSWSEEVLNGSSPSDWWRERVQVPPDWSLLWEDLRWTWHLHVYGFACLFTVLACAGFFTILGLRAQILSRPHLTSLNMFLCILGTARALGLFIDPYGSRGYIPAVLFVVVWDVAFPSLLAAFSLLQLAFLQLTQVQMAPSRLSSETCLTLVVTFHFCMTITSDILWTLQNSLRIVWLLTQLSFTLWGSFLSFFFLTGSCRLLQTFNQLPFVFLSTSSSSYDAPRAPKDPLPNLGPKIRITDENDQTFSYASESQHNVELRQCLVSVPNSPSNPSSPALVQVSPRKGLTNGSLHGRKDRVSSHIRSQSLPLMANIDPPPNEHSKPINISETERKTLTLHQTARSERLSCPEEFWYGSHKVKPSRRNRVEKLLQKVIVCAVLGAMACLLQIYGVLGPHGLSARRRKAQLVPWFCYQTLYRLVELILGTILLNISRESLHCHHGCASAAKHRNSLFS